MTFVGLPILAHLGHAVMSDLSPLSGEERKLDFGAARSAFDPEADVSLGLGCKRARKIAKCDSL
jgi:hypothetical protein